MSVKAAKSLFEAAAQDNSQVVTPILKSIIKTNNNSNNNSNENGNNNVKNNTKTIDNNTGDNNNNNNVAKIPGYDGPNTGNTRTTDTKHGSNTQTSVETVIKNTQVHRTHKGPIQIKEINLEGKYVLLENNGKRGDIDISKWQLRRKIGDADEMVFTFPETTIFAANSTITIWSKNEGTNNPPKEYVYDFDWGMGDVIITRLLNLKNDERALYSQRTS